MQTISVALNSERVLLPADYASLSTSPVADITGESNPSVCRVLSRIPLRVLAQSTGLSTTSHLLEDGSTGAFVIEVV